MLPYPQHEETPLKLLARSWPREFTTRRNFYREGENQPYVDWLGGLHGSHEDDCDPHSSSDGEDGPLNKCNEHLDDGKGTDVDSHYTNVRLFMEWRETDIHLPRYHDQAEQVARFCKQAGFNAREKERTHKEEKNVAWLDDRNNADPDSMPRGRCRPFLGPLTAKQLTKELRRKVT